MSELQHRQTRQSTQPPASDAAIADLVEPSAQALLGLRHEGQRLRLRASRVRSPLAGPNISTFKGRGLEYAESRPYTPGDDVRSLDWRVIARSGKPHTKLFHEERERSVLLWVDMRAPMWFATRGAFKSVVAARTATLLAWSAAARGDRIGGLVFSENEHTELRPGQGDRAVLTLIRRLGATRRPPTLPGNATQRADVAALALARLRRVTHPGSLVFLCSDGRDLDARAEAHLSQLTRHSDLVMVFIHDPLERALPDAGRHLFSDGVTKLSVDTAEPTSRSRYQQAFSLRIGELRRLCARHHIFLLPCTTDQELPALLRQGLGLTRP